MIEGYIGARRPEAQHRWFALLSAAMGQPKPTQELQKAIEALKKQTRGRYHEERQKRSKK